jgi:branched-chain amino acid aminotransferase
MTAMKVWLDGGLVDAAQARVSAFDHGFTVGDGIFETCKVVHGRPFALSRHLERLAESAYLLGLPAPDPDLVRAAVTAVVPQVAGEALARLRITVTGGEAPLGSGRGSGTPTLFVAVAPVATRADTESVAVVPWLRNERGATAGVKTTSYAENVIALAHARRAGAGEAILANTVGHLCEGTGSNVFLVRDGSVATPPLSSGCLAGVTRALVLAWCPDVVEEDLDLGALQTADEVFLTSSTRDVQGVHAVDGRRPGPSPRRGRPEAPIPGPVTAAIAEVFAARAATDDDPL